MDPSGSVGPKTRIRGPDTDRISTGTPETALPRASFRMHAMPTSDVGVAPGDACDCATRPQPANRRNPSSEKRQFDSERGWCSTKRTGRVMWRMFTPRVWLCWDGECYMPVRKKALQKNGGGAQFGMLGGRRIRRMRINWQMTWIRWETKKAARIRDRLVANLRSNVR